MTDPSELFTDETGFLLIGRIAAVSASSLQANLLIGRIADVSAASLRANFTSARRCIVGSLMILKTVICNSRTYFKAKSKAWLGWYWFNKFVYINSLGVT